MDVGTPGCELGELIERAYSDADSFLAANLDG
jgi:hypothetical protein